jgi:hypothetical protein
MDVFKLAFETIVVGLLAFVWLGVATYLVIFFALLAYGGWMSSEIIYDQQVISSFAVFQGAAETQKR